MGGEINFRFLRELQRKERESPELQKLPDDFIDQLRDYIKRKVELLSKPEMLTFAEKKEIENLKPVIKCIFERREQKIVRAALHAARTGIKPKNMLPHEEALFNALKHEIVKNRLLLDDILMLIDPLHRNSLQLIDRELEVQNSGEEAVNRDVKTGHEMEKEAEKLAESVRRKEIEKDKENRETEAEKEKGEKTSNKTPSREFMRLEIIKDVPAFIGIDLNKYGPWKKGQIVAVPEKIARALVKTGRARELRV